MNTLPTKEENPEGLHYKYNISKADGSPTHPDAEYFILRLDDNDDDPEHIYACKKAVITYAVAIRDHNPKLAKDLIKRYDDGKSFIDLIFPDYKEFINGE